MGTDTLIKKIQRLSQNRITEVEDFVDFLSQREQDQALVYAATKLAEDSFKEVWDNPDDADYDRL